MKTVDFLNIPISSITMEQTLQEVEKAILNRKQIHHSVVNAGKIVLMQSDKDLQESVINADIINADGQAVVWAANLLGKEIPERVSGIDLMQKIVAMSNEKNYKCFFFGATNDVVLKLINNYTQKYSKDIVAGFRNGYFNEDEENDIAQEICDSGADILFVAITSPKKEIFLNKYKEKLKNVNFIMGVGGSFDVISGMIKRAPNWMQIMGLEWFFRLIQEPKRMWKRYLFGNFNFIRLVLKEYYNSR